MNPRKQTSILLVNPWIHDFAAYDFWAKPLGLLYLAALLRAHGYAISFLDCLNADYSALQAPARGVTLPGRTRGGRGKFRKQSIEKPRALHAIPRKYSRYGIPPAVFEEQLNSAPVPGVILVTSGMTYWYPGVIETIGMLKTRFPGVPVILGGIYPSLCPVHARRYSGADVVVSGPGELLLVDLVSSITGIPAGNRTEVKSLDTLPYPAFDLIDPLPYLCITTSRGCPYRCRFCASHLLSPTYSVRSPRAVVDEIQHWCERSGIRDVAFYDDALFYNPESHIIPLLELIVDRGITCSFHTPNGIHVTGMNDDIARRMVQAGFRTIRLGLETASEERMAEIGKKTTRREFLQTVRSLRDAGYAKDDIGVYLLAGLPGQRADELEDSICFVHEAGARPYLAEYSPIPGTSLWNKAVEASPFDLRNEPLYHNNSIFPCQWEGFTRKDLDRLKRLLRG